MCSGEQHLEGRKEEDLGGGDDGIARSLARLMRDSRTGLHQSPPKSMLGVRPLYPVLTSPWRPSGEGGSGVMDKTVPSPMKASLGEYLSCELQFWS